MRRNRVTCERKPNRLLIVAVALAGAALCARADAPKETISWEQFFRQTDVLLQRFEKTGDPGLLQQIFDARREVWRGLYGERPEALLGILDRYLRVADACRRKIPVVPKEKLKELERVSHDLLIEHGASVSFDKVRLPPRSENDPRARELVRRFREIWAERDQVGSRRSELSQWEARYLSWAESCVDALLPGSLPEAQALVEKTLSGPETRARMIKRFETSSTRRSKIQPGPKPSIPQPGKPRDFATEIRPSQ